MKKTLRNIALVTALATPSVALAQRSEQATLPSCDPAKKYETVQKAMDILGIQRIESFRPLRGGYVTSNNLTIPLNNLVQYIYRTSGADPETERYAGLPAVQRSVYNNTDGNGDCVITNDELQTEYARVRKGGNQ